MRILNSLAKRLSALSLRPVLEALEARQLLSAPVVQPLGDQSVYAANGAHPAATPDYRTTQSTSFTMAWVENNKTVMVQDKIDSHSQWSQPINLNGVAAFNIDHVSVTALRFNLYAAVWTVGSDTIQGRLFNTQGPVGDIFQVAHVENGFDKSPDIQVTPQNDFVVTWAQSTLVNETTIDTSVYLKRFNLSGVPSTPDILVASHSGLVEFSSPSIAFNDNGYVIAYATADGFGTHSDIRAQAFDMENQKIGTPLEIDIAVASITQPRYTFGYDSGSHTYIFAWEQFNTDTFLTEIVGRYFDDNLTAVAGPFLISSPDTSYNTQPSLDIIAPGHAIVVYRAQHAAGEPDAPNRVVLGVQYNLADKTEEGRLQISTEPNGISPIEPVITADGSGGFTVLWTAYNDESQATTSVIGRTYEAITPKIRISGNGYTITPGLLGASESDHTDFGWITTGSGPITRTFTITNPGNATLELGEITLPAGFTVTDAPTQILPGESATLAITFQGDKTGAFSGQVIIPTNTGEDFTFPIEADAKIGVFTFTRSTVKADRTHIDQNGNSVIFTLTGSGTGTVLYDPESREIISVSLDRSTSASALTIDVVKTLGQGTGVTSIQNININSDLNTFTAAKVDLLNNLIAESNISAITLHDITGPGDRHIDIRGAINTRTDFTLGHITDLKLETNGYIGRFTAIDWNDFDSTPDTFDTGSIGTLIIAGDFQTNLTSYGTGRQGGPSITTAVIGGTVSNKWVIYDHTGSVTVGAAQIWDVQFEDGIDSLTVKGTADSLYLLAGYLDATDPNGFVGAKIGKLTVGGWMGGGLKANSVTNFLVIGRAGTNLVPPVPANIVGGLFIIEGYGSTDAAPALGLLQIAGLTQGSTFLSGGVLGTISIKNAALSLGVTGSRIAAFNVDGAVTGSTLQISGSINSIRVGTWLEGNISGQTLGTLNVTGIAKTAQNPAVPGDIDAALRLTGNPENTRLNTLGTVNIKGELAGSFNRSIDWDVTGSVGSVTVGSFMAMAFTIRTRPDVVTRLASFKAGHTDYWDITAPGVEIGSITLADSSRGEIYAARLTTLNVTGAAAQGGVPAINGDFDGIIQIGKNQPANTNLLGNVTISGNVDNTTITSPGNVGAIRVNTFLNSTLFVGVVPTYPTTGMPLAKSEFTSLTAKLQSFTVIAANTPAGQATFLNSRVAAAVLANVSLQLVGTEGDFHTDTGFSAATRIGNYRRLSDLSTGPRYITVSNQTQPDVYDEFNSYILTIVDDDLPAQ